MSSTREELGDWFDEGIREELRGLTHMVIVCDTVSHNDHPLYFDSADAARAKATNPGPMAKTMEVYDLRADKAGQLAESRAWNFGPEDAPTSVPAPEPGFLWEGGPKIRPRDQGSADYAQAVEDLRKAEPTVVEFTLDGKRLRIVRNPAENPPVGVEVNARKDLLGEDVWLHYSFGADCQDDVSELAIEIPGIIAAVLDAVGWTKP